MKQNRWVPEATVIPLRQAFDFVERVERILMEPIDFEYGERQYNAEDPFGHRWTFTQTLRDTAPQE